MEYIGIDVHKNQSQISIVVRPEMSGRALWTDASSADSVCESV